jgi:hypothetical protein
LIRRVNAASDLVKLGFDARVVDEILRELRLLSSPALGR